METFPRYWPFVRGIHRAPVNFPHKGQWRGALVFCLICIWINAWVNNREAGDLRGYHAHYDVTVVITLINAFRGLQITGPSSHCNLCVDGFHGNYVSGCSQDIVDTVYVSTLKPGRFPIYVYAMHRSTSQDIAQRLSSLINNNAFFALQSVCARVVVSKTTMYVDTPRILLTRHLSTHWDQVGLVFMSLARTVCKDIAWDENHDQSKAEHFCMHQIQIGRNVVLTFQFPGNICLYYYATVRVSNLYDMLVPRRR